MFGQDAVLVSSLFCQIEVTRLGMGSFTQEMKLNRKVRPSRRQRQRRRRFQHFLQKINWKEGCGEKGFGVSFETDRKGNRRRTVFIVIQASYF